MKRRRFESSELLKEGLTAYADNIRAKASHLAHGEKKQISVAVCCARSFRGLARHTQTICGVTLARRCGRPSSGMGGPDKAEVLARAQGGNDREKRQQNGA